MMVRNNLRSFILLLLGATFGLAPAASSESFGSLSEASQLMGLKLQSQWSSLPSNGQIQQSVWTGDHWPYKKGGLLRRKYGNLSPMEKFAKVCDYCDPQMLRDEKDLLNRYKNSKWGGHCNGRAISSVLHPEPVKSIEYRGVVFRSDEVKALLMAVYQNSQGKGIGGQCRVGRKQWSVLNTGQIENPLCRDINPGLFHILLANFVGLKKRTIFFDILADSRIDNFPVRSYRVSSKKLTSAAANQVLGEEAYPIDLNGSLYRVTTQVSYIAPKKKDRTYTSIIELNEAGEVTGGKWTGKSKATHPDFAWIETNEPDPMNVGIDIHLILDFAKASAQ